LSRPFWLSNGFHPAGYGVLRLIQDRPPASPSGTGQPPRTGDPGRPAA
jgi:hypothetical protein